MGGSPWTPSPPPDVTATIRLDPIWSEAPNPERPPS
jgi:hypothetical protein